MAAKIEASELETSLNDGSLKREKSINLIGDLLALPKQ